MAGAANSVQVTIGMNSVPFTTGIKLVQAELDKFSGKSKQAGHATVSSMQAASASIRELNGNFANNTRAVERFITTIPGVGKVLQAAFPLIGGLAFGAMLVEMGMKVATFIKTAENMPKAITQGFGALNLATKTSIDSLQLQNDVLQNSINKFEHKGQNNPAIMMDEARLAADKLASSIEKSNASLNELLSKNHLSGWALLMGKQGTADREGTAKAFGAQSDSNAYDLANATTPAQTAAAQKALKDTQNAQLGEARKDLAKRQGQEKGGPDNGANIAIDKGVITAILNQQKEADAEMLNAKLAAQNKADDASKAATEQAKQAAEKRLQAMVASLEAEKLQGSMSLKQVYDYWDARRIAFTAGSTQYNQVVAKQAQVAVEAATKAHQVFAKATADDKRDSAEDSVAGPDIINRINRNIQQNAAKTGAEQNQDARDSNEMFMDGASNKAREDEAKLSIASMSQYAKAVELAAIHARELKDTLTGLSANVDIAKFLADQAKANGNPDDIRQANKGLTQAQISYNNASRQGQIQGGIDQQNINPTATSGASGFDDAINSFVIASRDAATQMRDLTTNTLQGLNETILHVMTTPHMTGRQTKDAFGNYGAGLAKSVAGASLNKAEGSILGAFGGGKLGSKGNPMAVTIVGGSGASGAASGAVSSAIGAATKGGGFSGFLGGLLHSVLPGFASGGAIGGPAIVGEKGPELFIPGQSGTIVPNHKLVSSGATGHTINFRPGAIDARGATDPAQVDAAVQRGIAKAAPHLTAASVQAVNEHNKRRGK
jgi:hypothetical protein